MPPSKKSVPVAVTPASLYPELDDWLSVTPKERDWIAEDLNYGKLPGDEERRTELLQAPGSQVPAIKQGREKFLQDNPDYTYENKKPSKTDLYLKPIGEGIVDTAKDLGQIGADLLFRGKVPTLGEVFGKTPVRGKGATSTPSSTVPATGAKNLSSRDSGLSAPSLDLPEDHQAKISAPPQPKKPTVAPAKTVAVPDLTANGITPDGTVKTKTYTTLNAEDEDRFQAWYRKTAKELGLNANPDDPNHKYDYRAFWRKGGQVDGNKHFDSRFKDDDHPNRFILKGKAILDTKYGRPVPPDQFASLATPEQKATIERAMPRPTVTPQQAQKMRSQNERKMVEAGQNFTMPEPSLMDAYKVLPGMADISNMTEQRQAQQLMEMQRGGVPSPTAGIPNMEPPKPLSLGGAFEEAGKSFARGTGNASGSVLKGIARWAQVIDEHMGNEKKLDDYGTYKLGQNISKWTKEVFPGRPDLQKNFLLTTLFEGAGSSIPFLATGAAGAAIGGGAGTAAALTGALAGSDSMVEQAPASATKEQRRLGLVLGGAFGLTEGIPIADLFKRMNLASGGTLATAVKSGTVQAIEEAIQEGFQQLGENVVKKYVYDMLGQDLTEGTGEGAAAGGIIGFLTGFMLSGRGRLKGAAESASPEAKTGPETTKPTPPPSPPGLEEIVTPKPAKAAKPAKVGQIVNREVQKIADQVKVPDLAIKEEGPPKLVKKEERKADAQQVAEQKPSPPVLVPTAPDEPKEEPKPEQAKQEQQKAADTVLDEPLRQELQSGDAERVQAAVEEVRRRQDIPQPDEIDEDMREAIDQDLELLDEDAESKPGRQEPEVTEQPAATVTTEPPSLEALQQNVEEAKETLADFEDSTSAIDKEEVEQQREKVKEAEDIVATFKDDEDLEAFTRKIEAINESGVTGQQRLAEIGDVIEAQAAKRAVDDGDLEKRVQALENLPWDPVKRAQNEQIIASQEPPPRREQEAPPSLEEQPAPQEDQGKLIQTSSGRFRMQRKDGTFVTNPVTGGVDFRTEAKAREVFRNTIDVKPKQEPLSTPELVPTAVQAKKDETRKPNTTPPGGFVSSVGRDEEGNPSFDYSALQKRPSVKQIMADWTRAGQPSSFTVQYGETDATFKFEELHGIAQWWDQGNGAGGIDRNKVLDALKAAQPKGESPSTAQSIAPDITPAQSKPAQSPPSIEQAAKPERELIIKSLQTGKEEILKVPAPPAPSPTPEQVAKPKPAPIAVPLPNFDDMRSSAMDAQKAFTQATTLDGKTKQLERVLSLRKEFKDRPGFVGGSQYYSRMKFFDEMISRMNGVVENFKPAPPTLEVSPPSEKPATLSPLTPEEVSNEQPKRVGPEDSASPGATPAEVVPLTPAERPTEGVRTEATERRGGRTEQPGGRRAAATRSDGENTESDLPAERGGSPGSQRDDATVSGPAGTDYRIPENLDIPTGQKAKFKANVAAIELLKRIEAEGRLATPDEQTVLAKYTGWGGLPQAFQWSYEWQKELSQLRELLTEEEYNSARASTPNAHYTDPATIKAIYTGLEHLGFKGGRLLEPGAGVGHFLGAMPEGMAVRSQRTAIELDSISARIAKQLYQRANVVNNEYQQVALPQDFFDVAVGNVPFANVKVFDPNNKALNKLNFSLHDYYFAKAISQVRPGGIVAFITSRYTMDKVNGKLRDYLSNHADLLGAIRLPNTQFKAIANTEVTTDIIVLQKREPGTVYAGQSWGALKDVQTDQGPATINEYFAAHPEQIMGKLSLAGSMYREKEITVESDNRDMLQALREAFARLPEKVLRPRARPASTTTRGMLEALQASDDVKNGAFTIQNNALYVRDGDQFLPIEEVSATDLDRAKGLIGLREQVREVFRTQLASADDENIVRARKELNARYDKFVKKWGPINGRANKSLFRSDPDYATLQALEKDYDKKANTAKKADIFSKRVIEYRSRVTTAGSPNEALLVSLNESGKIDFDRMAELTGQTTKELQEALRGVVYQDPSGTWETADAYLSGNVRQKLKAAEESAKIDPRFKENVEALKQVIPEDLKPEQIHMKLGHGWVPTDVYRDFIAHLLDIATYNKYLSVKYNAQVGAYSVTLPKQLDKTRNETTYGTPRYEAKYLIEDGLHSQLPTVWDRQMDDTRVVNEKETLAAREKLEVIQEEFRKWVWQDPGRTKTLTRLYNDEFNSVVERKFDGSHLTLPGANPLITLKPHQKNVIWRALQEGNTLLGHVVGAGKTFAMVGIAMESRRLRLANKPMITVPNHLVEQWRDAVLQLYPAAKVLMATKEDFKAENRRQLVGKIATGDWDLVVISHTQLSRIQISLDSFEKFVNEQTEMLEEYIREMKQASGKKSNNIVKELENAKKRLETKLKTRKAEVESGADNVVSFEETGVDMLLVDEADLFKNLYFPTRMTRVAGLPNSESQRSYDLFLKTQYLNKLTKNKGVIFATGTPVSNSMAEVFTMQRYLQPQELEKAGLTHFDAWARQFGNVVTSMELAPDGSGYRPRTRFAEFVNVPELTQMFRQVMDVHIQDDLKLPVPKLRTGKPINLVAKASEALKAYTADLIERAENLKKLKIDPRKDNMLKITGDGRNAALDIRLRVPNAPEDKNGKVALLVNQVVEEHARSTQESGTQLVFLDLSTPKGEGKAKKKKGEPAAVEDENLTTEEVELEEEAALRGSVYEDLKRKLIRRGIPEAEIAFIHDAKTDPQKTKLFADVNAGRIRVLIGSTEKMGAGTNVQERMVALHNLDAPWRPRDLEQRNGRGIRQGNKLYKADPDNFEFAVFNYATEAPSFDVYMWQILEAKAKTIAQVMRGDPTIRTIQDVDLAVMSIAEMKAVASGNPLIKERMTVEMELRKLHLLKSQQRSNTERLRYELASIPSIKSGEQKKLDDLHLDKAVRDANVQDPSPITIEGALYDDMVEAGNAILEIVRTITATPRTEQSNVHLGSYRGFNLGLKVHLDGDAEMSLLRAASARHIRTTIFRATDSLGLMKASEPSKIVWRLDNALKGIDTAISESEGVLKKTDKREGELKAEIEKPFDKEERLQQLEARVAEIDKQLDLTKKDEGIIAGAESPQNPEEPKASGILDKLMEERGSIPASPFSRATNETVGFQSSNPEVEQRVRAAKGGLGRPGLLSRVREHAGHIWRLISREFEHLPDTAEFSRLRSDLLKLSKYKGIAADEIQRELAAIVKPLNRQQYDQFEWKALLEDLQQEADAKRLLPFGYTAEQVQEDLENLNASIGQDSAVQEAWAKRQQLWARLKRDYRQSMDAIGFDVSKKLTKDNYFRHQVLEYAREHRMKGAGAKIRTPTGRGFLKTRKGSTADINANYVQAEFEVMAQMVYDTQLAKVIAGVDQSLNIRKSLQAQAKAQNNQALQAIINAGDERAALTDAALKGFRQRLGMHMSRIRKALGLGKDDPLSLSEIADIAEDSEHEASLSARGVFKVINERKVFVDQVLGEQKVEWQDLIPDTHELWQPREGNVFYMVDSVPMKMMRMLHESMLAEVALQPEMLRKVLAMGAPREQYVIPKEAKATLDQLSHKEHSKFVEFNRHSLRHWKALMLAAPRRIVRYIARNTTGDMDAMFVGNPGSFAKLPRAAQELLPVIFKDTVLSGEVKEWVKRGGYGTTLQTQELGNLNDLKAFKVTLDRATQGGVLTLPLKVFTGYWKGARMSIDYMETMRRYAAYLSYLEQMQENKGVPKNFGASRKETVMALPDMRDRAFKLSNELLGAYDRVSVAGQTLRDFWVPFYSWWEVNATRYARLATNAFDGGHGGQFLAKGALVTGKNAAAFLVKAAFLWSALQAWNYLFFEDDEEELRRTNPTVGNRPHILFGRDEKGQIQYLAGVGALGDLLAWVGLDSFPGLVGDLMHDRITIGEAVQNAAKAPVNRVVQGITPMVKLPVELATGLASYPDAFRWRPIQDRAEYLGYQTTFGPEISAMMGKPGKPLYGMEDLTGLLVQRTDPKAAAYSTWQTTERKLLERMGKTSPALFWRSPKGEALHNWAVALKQKDADAETAWREQYIAMEREKYGARFSETKLYGDIEKSLRAQAPLSGMTKAERDTLLSQLTKDDRAELARAEEYYRTVMMEVLPAARKVSFQRKLQSQGWLTNQPPLASLEP